jgi:hypothetical protein
MSGIELMDVGIVIALQEEFEEFHNEIEKACTAIKDPKTGNYYALPTQF